MGNCFSSYHKEQAERVYILTNGKTVFSSYHKEKAERVYILTKWENCFF